MEGLPAGRTLAFLPNVVLMVIERIRASSRRVPIAVACDITDGNDWRRLLPNTCVTQSAYGLSECASALLLVHPHILSALHMIFLLFVRRTSNRRDRVHVGADHQLIDIDSNRFHYY
ncbi:unnamed protein product [Cylicocyclus nassatus]|uniref:Uncharacterized protein n=1 Tax=Cylicocyclus nassatus TaxID=53992 RepID=A0AA36GJK4_CYLNA|nr:unnamed protein product [Cylicocyclus nassatus]